MSRTLALDRPLALTEENLLRRDLHAEVATSNHDGISLGQNVVEILQAFLVLNLRNDLDGLASGPKHVPDVVDVRACSTGKGSPGFSGRSGRTFAHKRGSDEIHTLGETEVHEVVLVLETPIASMCGRSSTA